MSLSHKRFLAMMLTLALAILMYCPQPAQSVASAAANNIITAGVFADPTSLDPARIASLADQIPNSQIFDTLMRYDLNFNLKPNLAEAINQVNPVTYRIKLRKGVHFHNGQEMKAADVIYSLTRTNDPSLKVAYRWLAGLDSINSLDDYTLELKLKKPDPLLLHWLANYQTAVVPKAYVEQVGADAFAQKPIGTGPFKFVSWQKDNQIELTANKDYFLGAPKIGGLILRTIPDESTMELDLERGSLDIVQGIYQDDMARLKANPNLVVGTRPQLTYRYLSMNGGTQETGGKRVTPFKDSRVRMAILYAVRWDQVMRSVAPDPSLGTREYCDMPPTSLWKMEDTCKQLWPRPEYNVDKAKQLLADAGYATGFKTSIIIWQQEYQRMAVPIQADLKKVGIDVEIRVVEIGTWVQAVNTGDFDMYLGFWPGADAADPQPWLYSMFDSASFGSPGNRARYKNPAVDKLLDAAINATGAQRIKDFEEAQKLILKDMPVIPIYRPAAVMSWNKRVQGFTPDPFTGWAGGHFRFWQPPSVQVSIKQ